MLTRRKALFAGAAFPAAIATAGDAAAPAVEPPKMFYVYAFNPSLMEFEIVGAYSDRGEAEAFLETVPYKPKGILRRTWREVIDMMVTARLGPIADSIRELTGGVKT